MGHEPADHDSPTRRTYLKYGGAVIGGGLFAGCSGQSGNESAGQANGSTSGEASAQSTEAGTTTATEAGAGTSTGNETAGSTESEPTGSTSAGANYTAELPPVGTVTLDQAPTSVFALHPWFPDMATALGQGDTVNYFWWSGTAESLQYFTAGLDGIEISWAGNAGEHAFTKEQLYELDSDLHLVDPAYVSAQDNWNRNDVEEVAENVAPWFGNYYSSYHATPPQGWAEGYEYVDLWEDLFAGVSRLYGERSRYENIAALREAELETIRGGLPAESERPSVAYLSISTDLSAIYVLRLNAPGYWNAHTRPLGATDVFSDQEFDGGPFSQIDMEALLEADPDAILGLWTVSETVDFGQLKQNLENDPVGSQLSAVQNDRVYAQGTRWQGPLMNLFQTEMTAKQLYPDQFGQWPSYENGDSYPEFGGDEQLFDHQRLGTIVGEGT